MSSATRHLIGLPLVIVACATVGCAQPVVRTYEGKPLPDSRISRVFESDGVVVRYVDGTRIRRHFGDDMYRLTRTYELVPGRHELLIARRDEMYTLRDRPEEMALIKFDFEAGRSYGFLISELHGPGAMIWTVQLVDHATGMPVSPSASPQ